MIDDLEKKLRWLFLIVPGFYALFLIRQIVDLGEIDEFDTIFYSMMLNFLIFVISFPIFFLIGKIFLLSRDSRISVIILLSIIIIFATLSGISIGVAAQHDLFFVFLRSLPGSKILNTRSANRPLVLLLSQNTAGMLHETGDARPGKNVSEAWLKIYLDNDTVYEGWPEFYGVGAEVDIFLSPACVMKGSTSETLERVPGPGALIFEKDIRAIEFVERRHSSCYGEYFPP